MTWCVVAALLATSTVAPGSAKDLASVRSLIAKQGAQQALSVLVAAESEWDAFLDQIATGRAEWLTVAAALRPVSDAHASETLDIAIQEALPRNAAGVLGLVAQGSFTAAGACGMYGFGQVEDERPTSTLLGLVDKRLAAVSRVTDSRLVAPRDACLRELKFLRSSLGQ